MTRLQAHSLTLRIGARTLCRDLSLALNAGENWVVLGPNGSGKSTLLATLAGLQMPAAGDVRLDGNPITGMVARERARQLALLLQDYETGLSATVMDTVLSGRHPHLDPFAWEGEADRAIAREALVTVGLAGFGGRSLATLSGGERRRVEIAAVLAQAASISLYDEPTLHLDLHQQVNILEMLAARSRQTGHVSLFVLHDVNLAVRYATHALLLFGDGSHVHGPGAEILTHTYLERLYRCQLHTLEAAGRPVFIPQ